MGKSAVFKYFFLTFIAMDVFKVNDFGGKKFSLQSFTVTLFSHLHLILPLLLLLRMLRVQLQASRAG